MCKNLNPGTDLNSIKTTGIYFIGSSYVNAPIGYFYFMTLKSVTTVDLVQFGFSVTNGYMYKRALNNNIWSEWKVFG